MQIVDGADIARVWNRFHIDLFPARGTGCASLCFGCTWNRFHKSQSRMWNRFHVRRHIINLATVGHARIAQIVAMNRILITIAHLRH